ncbi:MAG: hypothetical protein Tsb009_05730 [Planctomycetaceae bacterium]
MQIRLLLLSCLAFSMLIPLAGCQKRTGGSSEKPIFLVSITRDGSLKENENEDLLRLDMALKLAGFALDEGRDVVIFFNIRGVNVAKKSFDKELKFKDNDTITAQLEKLIERGAKVHVCPICMKVYDVKDEEIIEGALVTTRPKLFKNIGSNTAVFSY